MGNLLSLDQLAPGQSATVRDVPASGALFLRVREMGLTPGTVIRFRRAAPLGDPLEFELRGYRLSLRRADAAAISVEPVSPPTPAP